MPYNFTFQALAVNRLDVRCQENPGFSSIVLKLVLVDLNLSYIKLDYQTLNSANAVARTQVIMC